MEFPKIISAVEIEINKIIKIQQTMNFLLQTEFIASEYGNDLLKVINVNFLNFNNL